MKIKYAEAAMANTPITMAAVSNCFERFAVDMVVSFVVVTKLVF
jgi:hypothetical protein